MTKIGMHGLLLVVKNEKPTGTLNLTKQVNLKENVNTSLVRRYRFYTNSI